MVLTNLLDPKIEPVTFGTKKVLGKRINRKKGITKNVRNRNNRKSTNFVQTVNLYRYNRNMDLFSGTTH